MFGRRRTRYLAGLAGALLVLAAVGVGTVLAADHAVSISGFAYSPPTMTVSVGDTVTWTNADDVAHTATADGGAFDTGNLDNGASNTVTFDTAGTFAYHCTIHAQMTGTITVEAAAAVPATPGPPGPTNPPTDTGIAAPTDSVPGPIGAAMVIGGAGLVGLSIARRRFAQKN